MKFKLAITFLVVLILAFSFSNFLREKAFDSLSAIYASVLVNLTNIQRVDANVDTLTFSSLLEKAAQMKADDMAEKGYFSHNTPDGKNPWYWITLAGYNYKYAGENLAVNFENSEDVQTAWKNSRGHFLNMINPKFKEIGIATSTGIYKGKKAVFVVQMFGAPKED